MNNYIIAAAGAAAGITANINLGTTPAQQGGWTLLMAMTFTGALAAVVVIGKVPMGQDAFLAAVIGAGAAGGALMVYSKSKTG